MEATIFLVAPFAPQMLLSNLASELNRFLLSRLTNLQPLCAILQADSLERIAPTLNML